jgi:hypothetical protein
MRITTDDTVAPRRVWPHYALATFAVIASYLASFGPARSLAERGMVPMDLCHYVYLPLPGGLKQQYLALWSRLDAQCVERDLSALLPPPLEPLP